jgi:hypothetical protein
VAIAVQSVLDVSLVTIYPLRDPRTLELRYVGKADDPERRFRQHVEQGQLNRYRSRKNSWLKGLLADGHQPLLEIIDEVEPDRANEAEVYWINWYLSQGARLTNGTAGGDGGAITDPEAKARVRAAHLGSKASDKTKKKMSAAAKARCADEKERERLRSISNGKPPVYHGEKNPRTKLSDAQVRKLREQAAAGAELAILAAEYGITRASVTQIVCGQTRVAAGGPTRTPRPRRNAEGPCGISIDRSKGSVSSMANALRRRSWSV